MNLLQRIFNRTKAPDTSRFGFGDVSDSITGRYGQGYVEAYEKIPTVYSCVRMNASNMAAVPIAIEERSSAGKWKRVEPGEKKFNDVAGVFERANPEEGKTSLWTRFHQFGELTGDAVLLTDYLAPPLPVEAVRPKSQAPKELWVIPSPDVSVKVVKGRRVWYEVGKEKFRTDEILYHTQPNPLSAYSGLPPVRPAQVWAQVEDLVTAYMRRAMQKGNISPFALKTAIIQGIPQSLKDEQMLKLENDWANKFHRGFLEKMVFLNHGMEPADLPKSFDSEGLINLANLSHDHLCQVFGIPPGLVGRDVTDHNIKELMPMYWETGLIPKLSTLAENLTEIVLPRFEPGGLLRARYDLDAVPAIQRMMETRAVTYVGLTGGPILSPNEARRRMNLPDMVGGETMREAATTVPSGPPIARSKRTKWIDLPERHEKRQKAADDVSRHEAKAEQDVATYFRAQETRLLAKVNRFKGKKDFDLPEIWDEELEIELARTMLIRIYSRTAGARGAEAISEVGGGDFLIDAPEVTAWLERNAYARGRVITGTTAELLRQVVTTANSEGLSVNELAGLIRDVFQVRSDAHALTIARTETIAAYNFTTQEAWRQSGVVSGKSWLTAQDDAVRGNNPNDKFSHVDMDGVSVGLDEDFEVPGDGDGRVSFPGDPSGDPANTLNCRCTLTPAMDGEKANRITVSNRLKEFLSPTAQTALTNGNRAT